MKKLILIMLVVFFSISISAIADQPVIIYRPVPQAVIPAQPPPVPPGAWENILIENQSQFQVLALGYTIPPGTRITVNREQYWPSQAVGQFTFTADAYAISSNGGLVPISQQTFYFNLDGNAQLHSNGQYYGAVVVMSYFPVVVPYNAPARSRQITLGPLSFVVNVDVWGSYPRQNYYPRYIITQETLVFGGRGNYHHRDNNRRGAKYYNQENHRQRNPK